MLFTPNNPIIISLDIGDVCNLFLAIINPQTDMVVSFACLLPPTTAVQPRNAPTLQRYESLLGYQPSELAGEAKSKTLSGAACDKQQRFVPLIQNPPMAQKMMTAGWRLRKPSM